MPALWWCGCLLLLLLLPALGAHANPTYAVISVTGTPLGNASATASLVLATSSIYSTFGNVTTIRGQPNFQFGSVSTFIEGCDPFTPPAGVRRPWIAIIQRGTCTYFAKAANAAQSGAAGVIIVDNVRSNTPVLMFSASTEPRIATTIVSVSLTYNAALRLLGFMDQHTNLTMTIAPGEDVPPETTAQPTVTFMFLNNLIVGVVAIGAFSFCVMFGFYMRSRSHRFVPPNDAAREDHMREARQVLLRLPTRSFISLSVEAVDDNDQPACAVCLENFKDGDLLRTLPCNHEMHQACIDPWLSDHSTCPLCKRDICEVPVAAAAAAGAGAGGDAPEAAAAATATAATAVDIPPLPALNAPGALASDIAMNPLAEPRAHAVIVVGPADSEPRSPNAQPELRSPAPNGQLAQETVLIVEDIGAQEDESALRSALRLSPDTLRLPSLAEHQHISSC